jgi:hypothetical protein
MTLYNAEITSTFLGPEDHGIMSFFIYLRFDGRAIGYGGFIGVDNDNAYQAIRRIIETIGAPSWEALKGKLCRIDFDDAPGMSGSIPRIGHIMEERWFDLRGYMTPGAI